MKNENTIVNRVTDYFGSGYKAAKALGVTPQQYYLWIKKQKIPFRHGVNIETATSGEIKAMEVWEAAGR